MKTTGTLWVAALAALAACCNHSTPSASDTRPEDSEALPDAEVDARPRPDAAPIWDAGPVVDAVAGSVVKIPCGKPYEVSGISYGHPYVVCSEWRDTASDRDFDVFLFNLEDETEITVSDGPRDQRMPFVLGNEVLWTDGRWYTPTNTQKEIFRYDILTQDESQLTDGGYYVILRGVSQTHLLYTTNEGLPPGEFGDLYLEDRQTGEKRFLCNYSHGPEQFALTETHVAFSAKTPYDYYPNRSVHLHDIAANQTIILPSTIPGDGAVGSMDGDYLYWADSRNGNYDIYRLQLSTGIEERLTDEPHDQVGPMVGGNLLAWMDFRYTGGTWDYNWYYGCDIVLHDLDTGVWRKLTGWSAHWLTHAVPQVGHLVYLKIDGGLEAYAMDLFANVLIDANNNVIP